MAPHDHVSWIGQALAALGITVGGAGVKAAIKQREHDVRLKELERSVESCPATCAETRRCVTAQTVRIDSLETGIERNYNAISALGERIDRMLESRGS